MGKALFCVVIRSTDDGKLSCAGNPDVIVTVNDQEVSGLVPASDDPDVANVGGKDKIAGLGLGPCDRRTMAVLCVCPAAVTGIIGSV